MSRWFPHPPTEWGNDQLDVDETQARRATDVEAVRARAIDECKRIVWRRHSNDYSAVDTLAEMEKLKHG